MTGLWKALFWKERRMSVEFGPPPAVTYREILAGLSDEDLLAHGDTIVAHARATRRTAWMDLEDATR